MRLLSIEVEHDSPDIMNFKYVGYITEDRAMQLQINFGYDPAGYGFNNFACINGIARWQCNNLG
jgi:hypothetical protein